MKQGKVVDGNERIYLDLLQKLRSADLTEKATKKELPVQPEGTIRVESFARTYLVRQEGLAALDSGPISFKQRLAVVSYVLSDATGEPSLEFVPFARLGGFNVGRDRHAGRSLRRPILARFGDAYGLFARAAAGIGGVERGSGTGTPGEHVWLFRAFPKLPIRLTFHERDEEFPADVHVLFDSRALEFLGLECLGFLPDYFTDALFGAADEVER